jgi:hypothetical protein
MCGLSEELSANEPLIFLEPRELEDSQRTNPDIIAIRYPGLRWITRVRVSVNTVRGAPAVGRRCALRWETSCLGVACRVLPYTRLFEPLPLP